MKKVGILVNSIGFGGNERSAVNIAKAIAGHMDVSVIIQEDRGNHYGYQGRVIDLKTPCANSVPGKAANAVRRVLRLGGVIRREKFDALLIILPVTNPINYMRLGCRKIVSCRDCGDLMKRTDKYIRMTERSERIVCNSQYQAEYLAQAAPHLKGRVSVVYNILDIDKVVHLKDEALDPATEKFVEGHRFIACTSRFAKAKGLNNMLKAFSLLAKRDGSLRLVLVGDGERRNDIEKLIGELGLKDKVILPGFQDNPFRYMAKADVYVLPSFYEGFPNTLIEAMATGTPVIATDCPSGPAEILCGKAEHGYTVTEFGVLAQAFSEEQSTWDGNDIREEHVSLADAIEKLLNDQALGKALAEKARTRVNAFTAEAIAAEWARIF